MATQTIPHSTNFSNTWIVLSDNSLVHVPDRADPDVFRAICESRIRIENNPKPKKQPKRTARRSPKRNHRADSVLSFPFDSGLRATARRMEELADEDTFVSGIEWDEFEKAGA